LLGCGKSKSTDFGGPTGGAGTGGAGYAGSAGTSGSSGASDAGGSGGQFETAGEGGAAGDGGSEAGGETGCVSEAPPDAALRRLGHFEYENSLRALVPEQNLPSGSLPAEPYGDPTAVPSFALVEAQHNLARQLAFRVTQTESATYEFVGCDPGADGEEECRDHFIAEFVARAFRRPLSESEIEEFTSTFDGGAADGEFALGVRATVQVALQSPEFLYLPEFGVEAPERGDGWARPAPYEMASRLAYLFWGSPPDAALLDAASSDALRAPEELEAQARRMLADDRAFKAVGHFYVRLLELDGATFPAAGLAEYPTFTFEIAAQLRAETEAFVAHATLVENGDFRALLTAPYTFVNEPLAAFYGIAGVTGDEFQRVEVDPTRRGGVLTHASFLAANALGPFTAPAARGARVAAAFLCESGEGHPTLPVVPEPLPAGTTTRQLYAERASDPACTNCHAPVDPLGFAFEHYDAAGLYRDIENGAAVDATGTLVTEDDSQDFDGALELAGALADSAEARRCFVHKWLAFALGRALTPADACYLEALEQEFVDGGTNLQELLIRIAQSDAFVYRPEVTP
jgi:hypothetical protein